MTGVVAWQQLTQALLVKADWPSTCHSTGDSFQHTSLQANQVDITSASFQTVQASTSFASTSLELKSAVNTASVGDQSARATGNPRLLQGLWAKQWLWAIPHLHCTYNIVTIHLQCFLKMSVHWKWRLKLLINKIDANFVDLCSGWAVCCRPQPGHELVMPILSFFPKVF